jgi:hypothetical protein
VIYAYAIGGSGRSKDSYCTSDCHLVVVPGTSLSHDGHMGWLINHNSVIIWNEMFTKSNIEGNKRCFPCGECNFITIFEQIFLLRAFINLRALDGIL